MRAAPHTAIADDLDLAADIPPSRLPVITIISLRGGTGCTTVAVNLAALLARAEVLSILGRHDESLADFETLRDRLADGSGRSTVWAMPYVTSPAIM